MLINLQKNRLCNVPGVFGVPQHAQRSVVDRSFVTSQKDIERCPVSVATPPHQLGIPHFNHKYRRRRKKLVLAGASTRQALSSIWKIRSKPEYLNMSRMCRLVLTRRRPPPVASSRFWVRSSTPRPALDMYSSFAMSTTSGAARASKNAWALAACDASRRPSQTTSPLSPSRISNIPLPHVFRNRNPALPIRIVVSEFIDKPPDELQAEPPRLALVERQAYVDLRRACDVVRLDVEIGEASLHAITTAVELELDFLRIPAVVLDAVGKNFLEAEVEDQPVLVGHALGIVEAAGKPEDLIEGVEGPGESGADQGDGWVSRRSRTIVTSSA